MDAIRSNYFTLAKWLLLVVEPRGTASVYTVYEASIERETDEAEKRIERNGVRPTMAWRVPGRAWLVAHRVSRNQRSMSLISI